MSHLCKFLFLIYFLKNDTISVRMFISRILFSNNYFKTIRILSVISFVKHLYFRRVPVLYFGCSWWWYHGVENTPNPLLLRDFVGKYFGKEIPFSPACLPPTRFGFSQVQPSPQKIRCGIFRSVVSMRPHVAQCSRNLKSLPTWSNIEVVLPVQDVPASKSHKIHFIKSSKSMIIIIIHPCFAFGHPEHCWGVRSVVEPINGIYF